MTTASRHTAFVLTTACSGPVRLLLPVGASMLVLAVQVHHPHHAVAGSDLQRVADAQDLRHVAAATKTRSALVTGSATVMSVAMTAATETAPAAQRTGIAR